ncbi:CynX/NimT family MFS transporter [Thermodesulfobacteriota bacterium]
MTNDQYIEEKGRYRWMNLALLWMMYASFGMVSRSIFPLVTPIIRDLHISYTQMGFILGSWQLTYILAALIAGYLLDRWGMHKTVFAGTVIIGLSAVLRFFPQGFFAMLLVVALFGFGGPVLSVGGPKMISEWFTGKSRSTAVSVYLTGPWIGGFIALFLTNSFVMPLTGGSWRLTFVLFGLVTFAVAFLWLLFARGLHTPEAAKATAIFDAFAELVKVRNVQVLLAMGLMAFAIGHGITGWLPKILEIKGMSASKAGFASSVVLAAAVPSILIIPRFVPSRLRSNFLALFAILTGISILTVFNGSGVLLIAGLILFGVADSVFVPLMLLILMDSPGVESRHMGAAGGMFFCVSEIGGVSGPSIVGALVDLTGSFMSGILFLILLSIFILGLTFFLQIKKNAEN